MAVVVIVGLVWLFVAGAAVLKVRSEDRLESVDGFQRQLRSFGGGLPMIAGAPSLGPTVRPAPLRDAAGTDRILRRVLAALLVLVPLTLLYAMVVSTRTAWAVHLFVDNAVLAYIALLVKRRDRRSRVSDTRSDGAARARDARSDGAARAAPAPLS